MKKSLALIFILINNAFLLYSQVDKEINNMDPLYFETPEKAIPEIRELINDSDWKTLSRYYNLKDSDIKIEELLSGDFFIQEEKPEVAHPGGFWKFKHPFPPSFKYCFSFPIKDNIYKIEMGIEIDYGDDKIQKGLHLFYMIKNDSGFQILPDQPR